MNIAVEKSRGGARLRRLDSQPAYRDGYIVLGASSAYSMQDKLLSCPAVPNMALIFDDACDHIVRDHIIRQDAGLGDQAIGKLPHKASFLQKRFLDTRDSC